MNFVALHLNLYLHLNSAGKKKKQQWLLLYTGVLPKVYLHLAAAIPTFPPTVKLCKQDVIQHAIDFLTFTPNLQCYSYQFCCFLWETITDEAGSLLCVSL